MQPLRGLAMLFALTSACASTPTPPAVPPTTEVRPAVGPGTLTQSSAPRSDAPEISRGVGVTGGVVIFWPRVSPRTEDPAMAEIASRVQGRVRAAVEQALPGRPVDVRPAPERVCPRQGCTGLTVGVMLAESRGACVAVALISAPGASPQRLVPWGGRVDLRAESAGFREPPEAQVVARDMVPCGQLVESLGEHEADVVAAIRAAAPAY